MSWDSRCYIQRTPPGYLLDAKPCAECWRVFARAVSSTPSAPPPYPHGSFPLALRCLLTCPCIRERFCVFIHAAHQPLQLPSFQAQGRRAPSSPPELPVAKQMCAEAFKSSYLTHHTPSLLPMTISHTPCATGPVHLGLQVEGCGAEPRVDPWMGMLHEWEISPHCYKPLRCRGYCLCSIT